MKIRKTVLTLGLLALGSASAIAAAGQDAVYDRLFVGTNHHSLTRDWTSIAGGLANTNDCAYSTVAGGLGNTILYSANPNFIGGGQTNLIAEDAGFSSILGGYKNTIGED